MPIFDDAGVTYPKRVRGLSVLQRATIEVFLQCQVSADGRISRLKGEQPAWRDILDAAIAAAHVAREQRRVPAGFEGAREDRGR